MLTWGLGALKEVWDRSSPLGPSFNMKAAGGSDKPVLSSLYEKNAAMQPPSEVALIDVGEGE